VERVCFILRVRRDRLDEYKARHREVWVDVKARWQAEMAPFLGERADTSLVRLEEVFHLE
jgi:L-rhamnose mutarotase